VFRKNYEFLSPQAVDSLIEDLSKQILQSGNEPELVIAIQSGGCYPGRKIAQAIGCRLSKINIQHYSLPFLGINLVYFPGVVSLRQRFGRIKDARLVSGPDADIQGKRVLLVDDDIESGSTIALAKDMLNQKGAASIKVAVLSPNKQVWAVDFHPRRLNEITQEVRRKKQHYGENFRFKWPWEPISPYHDQL
jgi:hypoxanthine phosphoribosyltransferase